MNIQKASSAINIDGEVDELAWRVAETTCNLNLVLPMDTSYTKVRTDVKMTYDEQTFYLLAICYKAFFIADAHNYER